MITRDSLAGARWLPIVSILATVVLSAGMLAVAYAQDHRSGPRGGAVTDESAAPSATDPNERFTNALSAGQPVTLVGLGSSVGVGATLPDPDAEAPVGRFAQLLRGAYPNVQVDVTNLSANGSVASEGLDVYRTQARPLHPTAVVVAFGMNDGLPGAYNSGQTFPGGVRAMTALVAEAQADGVAVILLTTPSPHTDRTDFSMPDGLPVQFPMAGGAATPQTSGDDVTTIGGAPFSTRHAEFNDAVRKIASDTGALLGDVAAHWCQTVAANGQDDYFDRGEFVHPNLVGHQVSYWPALDEVVTSLVR